MWKFTWKVDRQAGTMDLDYNGTSYFTYIFFLYAI